MQQKPDFSRIYAIAMGSAPAPGAVGCALATHSSRSKSSHRLLDPQTLMIRAGRAGRAFADIRLRPFRKSNEKARQFRDHPLLARIYCVWHLLKSHGTRWLARTFPKSGSRTGHQIHAEYLVAHYTALLRLASQMPEYQLQFTQTRGLPRRL